MHSCVNFILTQVTNVSMRQGKKTRKRNVVPIFEDLKSIDTFCFNCRNYKEELDKLLKERTEQQISIKKLEEIINKMQTNKR